MRQITCVIRALAAMLVAGFLAACGGGGGGNPGLSSEEVDRLNADPRVMRLENIVNHADTLIIPPGYTRYTFSVLGQTLSGRIVQNYRCSGTRCNWSANTQFGRQTGTFDLDDLPTDVGVTLTEVNLGSRAGFDTVAAKADLTFVTTDIRYSHLPASRAWGTWGEYGYAWVNTADGPVRGTVRGESFSGSIAAATAGMVADATGTNPGGSGSATWNGLAEAASTRTFNRHTGTASLTIPDLADPRIDAEITIAGSSVGSWNGMRMDRGRFGAGSAGPRSDRWRVGRLRP